MIPHRLTPIQASKLRNGEDLYSDEGALIYKNEAVTFKPKNPYSYAYCSDTRLIPKLVETVKNVDLMYHESTFMEDMKERAESTYHTTAKQAANLAKEAGVGQLLLGHFSTRYKDLTPMLREAQSIFPDTFLAEEGKKFIVNH